MFPFIKFLSLSLLVVVIVAVVIAELLIASSLFCVCQDEVNQIVTSNVRLRQVKNNFMNFMLTWKGHIYKLKKELTGT